MTLYLKYRSKNLDELDLHNVSESLKSIVSKKDIPHAFLFAGPKGTGKTSAARILAKIINCENLKDGKPCDKCEQCLSITKGNNLDVIEMDAASHRGIDDVRILRDAVKLSPVTGKKKIYIIDEVHMLTTEASNALLKTLEEPPEHVVFILATTNPEKLIDTIRSRTTLISFTKATVEEIVRSLKRVVAGEKIKIDDGALLVIAEYADGSFRDAIKVLEQLVAEEKELSKEFLEEYLFKNKSLDLDRFIKLLIERNANELIKEVGNLSSNGVAAEVFLETLIKRLRSALLAEVGVGGGKIEGLSKKDLLRLIEILNNAFMEIESSPIEELPLELAIISWCGDTKNSKPDDSDPEESEEIKEEKSEDLDSKIEISAEVCNLPELSADLAVDDSAWKSILAIVKPLNASMEALLRASKPVAYNGKVLTLGVYYKFHKERLEEAKHRKILEESVAKVLQSPTKVECVLVEPPPKKIIEESKIEPVLTEGKDDNIADIAEKLFSN